MARTKEPEGKEPQVHPGGDVITISNTRRLELKARREKLGLKQSELAVRARTTPATISNIETGRTSQPRKIVYARILRALRIKDEDDSEERAERYTRLVEAIIDAGEIGEVAAQSLLDSLAKLK